MPTTCTTIDYYVTIPTQLKKIHKETLEIKARIKLFLSYDMRVQLENWRNYKYILLEQMKEFSM